MLFAEGKTASTNKMETPDSGGPGSQNYVWEVPEKQISIHMDLDVMDLLHQETLRGFGVVPKRGVEVGGILLGSIEEGERRLVRIEDFEPVPCQHALGLNYQLTEEESRGLEAAVARWQREPGRRTYVVGFYRSHSREGALGLSDDDMQLYGAHFPEPYQVVLLVQPFTTRASVGGFFFREGGPIRRESSYLEFPFGRKELGGDERKKETAPRAARPEPRSRAPLPEQGGILKCRQP